MRREVLEFMRGVRAETEFELEPERIRGAEEFAAVVIILETDLRELAGHKRELRREPRATAAKRVARVEHGLAAAHMLAAQPRLPAWSETPHHLRIEAVVAEG